MKRGTASNEMMATFRKCSSVRLEIAKFAYLMEAKMATNDHKSSHEDLDWLMKRLREEVEELSEAVDCGAYRSIPAECADVVNFAMMIAENANGM